MRAGRHRLRSKKGQASIMIGLMMMTFLLFFAFVINTGVLVNAKINLQNAADVAAYAGAAVQARQLTHISYLNYELRRQYKKFLFRYLALGNMAQNSSSQTAGRRVWSADGSPDGDYGVPSVCLAFNNADNYCKFASLPKVEIPPATLLDSINNTLRDQLTMMEQARQKGCMSIGMANITLLSLWLYNTDPQVDSLSALVGGSDPTMKAIMDRMRGLSQGLGLIPRQTLTKLRINTLQYYINQPPQTGVTRSKADELSNSQDPAHWERTIQAFYSAYYTLGNHIFSDRFEMDELVPEGPEGAGLLALVPVYTDFTTYAVDMRDPSGQVFTPGGQPASCNATLVPIQVKHLPIAVKKDPTFLTYYAVRMRAKARLLFAPFTEGGTLELKAYSAAQPFGSRIGPQIDGKEFITDAAPRIKSDCAGGCKSIPNLNVIPGKSWLDAEIISGMFQQGFSGGAATDQINSPTKPVSKALAVAMAPNPVEMGKYNIPEDLGATSFVQHYQAPSTRFTFWAPIMKPDASGDGGKKIIEESLSELALTGSAGTSGAAGSFKQSFIDGFTKNYLPLLNKGEGENGEGQFIAVIGDPVHYPNEGKGQPISGGNMIVSDPALMRTSWSAAADPELAQGGRTGYSVKFISFSSLRNKNVSSDGASTWQNNLREDSEASEDLNVINH